MIKTTETLHDCLKCGTKNFTAKGLASHNCAKHAARRDASLAVAAKEPAADDATMGEQLTAQYHRATNAAVEMLRFGAMMMRLRDHLAHGGQGDLSVRGKAITGNGIKDGGISGWLEKHAPEVKRQTAQRFEQMAMGVAEEYPQIVGPKVAKQYALPDLVCTEPAQLAPAVLKKREVLFEAVNTESQKHWIEKLGPSERGGWRGGSKKQLTPEQEQEAFLAAAMEDFASAFMALDRLVLNGRWQAPSIADAELEAAAEVAQKFAGQAKAWLKIPQKKRTRPAFGDAAPATEPEEIA